jgi:polyphosphate kinase
MSNISNFNDMLGQEMVGFKSKFNSPSYYINRELSWMEFNKRVLHQALRKEIPLLERLKFLGITASNLDEFIMVRFASVLNKQYRETSEPDISGMTAQEEYEAILKEIIKFKELQEDCYEKLMEKINKQNITISKFKQLDKREKEEVEKLFTRFIYPLLTPITIDTTSPSRCA